MPEGPEVETVRRSLAPLLVGARLGEGVVSKKALRTPITSRALLPLVDRTVTSVDRHGKALFIHVDGEAGLQVRLGMTGRLLVVDVAAPREPHTHVRIPVTTSTGPRELRYVDPRRFGEVVPWAGEKARRSLAEGMGPDALSLDDSGRDAVRAGLRGTARALKDALLDQSLLAGVGNIYAAEILWLARLSPFRAGASLSVDEAGRLIAATERVLADAVARRGTSFSDYVDATGAPGDNAAHLAVFQREGEPCPSCGGDVRRVVQGQRSTFFCPRCQGARTPSRRAPRR